MAFNFLLNKQGEDDISEDIIEKSRGAFVAGIERTDRTEMDEAQEGIQ